MVRHTVSFVWLVCIKENNGFDVPVDKPETFLQCSLLSCSFFYSKQLNSRKMEIVAVISSWHKTTNKNNIALNLLTIWSHINKTYHVATLLREGVRYCSWQLFSSFLLSCRLIQFSVDAKSLRWGAEKGKQACHNF